jgi:KH domain
MTDLPSVVFSDSVLQNPPLYLHVTSTTKAGLEKAVEKVEELMQQELPNLVDERRFRRREPDQFERDEFGRVCRIYLSSLWKPTDACIQRKWPEERIPINMEPMPGFNLRAQVVGHGGSYVKHIQQETRCRVQIKGRGSGFMEHSTGAESDEPMYLHVAGPDPKEVQKAKELCEDLLGNVREQYERFKANPPPQRMESYTDGYGANANNNSYGGREYYGGRDSYGGGRGRDGYPNQSRDSYGSSYSPAASTPAPPGTAASSTDYAAQYAQYYGGGADPYAAYGGYQNYVAYYQYYAQQQAQQQGQAPPPPPGGESAPPPPPTGVGSPPPPPPSGSSYGAVPPPPGL